MRLAHITTIIALMTACSEPVVDLEGQVNGETVTGAAHWGGPHIVFTNSDMGCQEVDWVETSYGVSDSVALRTSESFAALQITFRSSDVVEGETPITATSPPANSWFLESDDGEALITTATGGSIDVEFDGEWLIGDLDVDFGASGQISGSFEIQSCVNLKSIEQ